MSIFEIPKYFWEKKYVKIREKVETIKKFKVWSMKKKFQICDDNFFFKKYNLNITI